MTALHAVQTLPGRHRVRTPRSHHIRRALRRHLQPWACRSLSRGQVLCLVAVIVAIWVGVGLL